MKVYFSCSLTGGRQDQPLYAALVSHLESQGHRVLTAHLASAEVMAQEAELQATAVFERDTAWIRTCDAVIAEVSTPSHGVGFEVAYALERAKPVLCCYRAGARVSKMITGNSHPGLRVGVYTDELEATGLADAFLAQCPMAAFPAASARELSGPGPG